GLCSGGRLQPPRHPGHRDPPRRPDRRRPAQTGLADPVGRDRRQGTAPLLVGPGRYRPRPARLPVAADPPQPPHRRAGVLPLLRPQARPYIDAGQGRRPSLDDRGGLPGRQGPVRPGPAPGPHLEILVPLTTLAMLAHAFLTAVAVSEHARQPAEPDLIPLTLAEIQHLM